MPMMPRTRSESFDLARARRETPGCKHVLHFNNAGAALMPQPVLDTTIAHLRLEARIGGYEAAAQAQDAITHVYDAVAQLIGCQREEVAIIENATRAWDMAFYSIPLQPGDRILTAVAEYASNYIAFLQRARQTGASIEVIPNDESGQLSVAALREMLDERVKLIAITHVPTNGGLVNPAAEIGAVAREAGALFLLDACQSVGQMPIDVQTIGCDMLSSTGRKYLRGPRGTGFLYVRQGLLEQLEPPLLDLHAATWISDDEYALLPDARRFENWETYYAGKIGLGVAIDYALAWGLDAIEQRITTLADQMRTQLGAIPGVTVRDQGMQKCGIVTFEMADQAPAAIQQALAARHINVSIAVLPHTRLDMEARHLNTLVRASVHYYNSEDEIAQLVETVAGLSNL